MQLVEADALRHTREVTGIARRTVVGEGPLRPLPVDQLDLVDDDPRLERVCLGDHQEPIEHPTMGFGLGRGEDDHDLIDVGGDDALALPFSRRASGQLRVSRQNISDGPVLAALIYLQNYPVTHRQFFRFLSFLLQPTAQRRFVRLTRLGADVPYSASSFQHDTFFARQLLPSLRITSHHGRSSERFAPMSESSLDFTSLRRIAPTMSRASDSVVAKARNSVSRCPLATGSP